MPLCGLKGVLNDIALSTQPAELLKVVGTVVAVPPPPTLYSLQPPTVLQVPPSVKPDVAVKVLEPADSAAPMVNESELGVYDVTAALVEPVVEVPVEDSTPEVVKPVISYIETDAATVEPKAVVTVSAPRSQPWRTRCRSSSWWLS